MKLRLAALLASFHAVACNDGALPPREGSASLEFDVQRGTGAPICLAGTHWMDAPLTSGRALDGVSQLQPVVDGQAGDTVQCRVEPSGDKYVVAGQIDAHGLGADGTSVVRQVFVRVVIGPGERGALGTLHAFDEHTVPSPYLSDTCLFSVAPAADEPGLGIDAGRFWASVTCAQIDDMRGQSGAECRIDGHVRFDNCAG